jgi:hypothetical protein
MVRCRAGVHPGDRRSHIQKHSRVIYLKQNAGRVASELLVECDLEGKGAATGYEVALRCYGTLADRQQQHLQLPPLMGLPSRIEEERAFLWTASKRRAFPALPSTEFEGQENVHPFPQIVHRSECPVFHFTQVRQPTLEPPILLHVLG